MLSCLFTKQTIGIYSEPKEIAAGTKKRRRSSMASSRVALIDQAVQKECSSEVDHKELIIYPSNSVVNVELTVVLLTSTSQERFPFLQQFPPKPNVGSTYVVLKSSEQSRVTCAVEGSLPASADCSDTSVSIDFPDEDEDNDPAKVQDWGALDASSEAKTEEKQGEDETADRSIGTPEVVITQAGEDTVALIELQIRGEMMMMRMMMMSSERKPLEADTGQFFHDYQNICAHNAVLQSGTAGLC
ncbi:UNVERIFIED_CONTAM: hypothetical protein FKN15_069781 [Acipenser sinensis]